MILVLLGLAGGGWPAPLPAQQPLVGEQGRLQLVPRPPIPLTGVLVGEALKVRAHPSGDLFLVIDKNPPALYAFDRSGRFIRSFGSRGEGPGQFLKTLEVTAWGDTLLMDDSMRGLVLAFRISSGEHVEHVALPRRLPAFAHWMLRKAHLILYWSVRSRPLIEVYDLRRKTYTHRITLFKFTAEHDVLLSYAGAGGLTMLGDSLVLAMPADRPTIYALHLQTGQQRLWITLKDAAFRVGSARDVWNDYRKFVPYLTSNSRTCGLFVLNDRYLVAQLEHGPELEQRWLRLIVIDPATRREIDRITFPAELRRRYQLHALNNIFETSRGDCLYLRRFLEEADTWALWPWCLESVPEAP